MKLPFEDRLSLGSVRNQIPDPSKDSLALSDKRQQGCIFFDQWLRKDGRLTKSQRNKRELLDQGLTVPTSDRMSLSLAQTENSQSSFDI